jgi:3-methyladenine DNA glycosylase/8-oxoguanine DNA glycosylase
MANGVDDVTNRVQVIEEKVDRLSASVDARFDQVDARFDQVDARFDQVDAAILEQRQYTEFAYSRLEVKIDGLETKMNAGFGHLGRIERKLDHFIDAQPPRRTRR